MTSASKEPTSSKIESGIIVLLLTAIAYVAAFAFDAAYLGYFGIPPAFAEVSLRGLLLTVTFAAALLFLLPTVDLILDFVPKDVSRFVLNRVLTWMSILVFFVVIGLMMGADAQGFFLLLTPTAVIAFSELVSPLIFHAKIPTYEAKLRAAHAADRSLGARWAKLGGMGIARSYLGIFLIGTFGGAFAGSLGLLLARTQQTFAMRDGGSCAVLRIRQEGLLCIELDTHKRVATGNFEFMNPAGESIKMESICPIRYLGALRTHPAATIDLPKPATTPPSAVPQKKGPDGGAKEPSTLNPT